MTKTDQIVRKSLKYDPLTGNVVWKKNKQNRWGEYGHRVESIAGNIRSHGYRAISISVDGKNREIYAHRIGWFLSYGEWPNQIDHINGNKNDNRLENLRECVHAENMQNTKTYITNKSGFKGVYFSKKAKKWVSQITYNYKSIYLGLFDTAEEAHEEYLRAKSEKHLFNPIPRK